MDRTLDQILQTSAAAHSELCPRQVLGVRMGLRAGEVLRLALPRPDKRLLVIAETDGCLADGISAATGCFVGRRTLRVEDLGKIAATFADTATDRCLRITAHPEARTRALAYAPEAPNRWTAQLLGYQRMPAEALLVTEWVTLSTPITTIVGEGGRRVICERCKEEIINQREVARNGEILCRVCAGDSYYRPFVIKDIPRELLSLAAGLPL